MRAWPEDTHTRPLAVILQPASNQPILSGPAERTLGDKTESRCYAFGTACVSSFADAGEQRGDEPFRVALALVEVTVQHDVLPAGGLQLLA